MTARTEKSAYLPQETQRVVDAFRALDTDEKLALLYYAYTKMGDSITPAAPSAAEPNLAPTLLGDYLDLPDDEQLQIMRDIVNRKDTPCSRAYGGLTENNQLLVWYAWAKEMGNVVVDMPADYEASQATQDVLGQIERLEFQEQISMLRVVAGGMGYSEVKDIPTQAETGKTPSL
jgi:hypothetical protein